MSNLSYMLLGAMAMSPLGLKAGLCHMLFHGIIKICLFMCAGAFMHQTGKSYIYEISGVGKRMPVTFACYTLCALSLTGIPLFCGFVSKWQLLGAGMSAAGDAARAGVTEPLYAAALPYLLYAGAAALIVAAFLCAMYTINISVRAFFPIAEKDRYQNSDVKEAGPLMLVPIAFFAICNVVLGVCPGPVLAFLTAIGEGRL